MGRVRHTGPAFERSSGERSWTKVTPDRDRWSIPRQMEDA